MSSLERIVAAHPLGKYTPYNALKFVRVDGNGTPLYRVGKDTKEQGPTSALRLAFMRFGANCFHCGDWMPPGSDEYTLDHVRPKKDDGEDLLHNLVFACRACNCRKGANDLVSFQADAGVKYLKALDEHLIRCLGKFAGK